MRYLENTRLRNAMSKGNDYVVSTWHIPGLHIQAQNLPCEAEIDMTFVIKCSNGPYQLGLIWEIDNGTTTYQRVFEEFSTLDEMQQKYPGLFELIGTLYAFP